MWYIIATTSLVLLSLAKLGYCEEGLNDTGPVIVYRPGTGSICPPRAVCADIFDYQQIRNGVISTLRRIIFNCRCSRDSREVCPVDEAHMVHTSPIQKQYLCRPVTTYPKCNLDVPIPQVAEEMEIDSPDFEDRNYFRINCICPRHGFSVPRVRGTLQRATYYTRTEFDFLRYRWYQQFVCTV
ncbi:hypothetical protein SNE40_001548 [Patella caerulea]|uniref:Uncharacterized protein n=1 Tax=Patella caerulea TaxID=87958 RepID=A0AAN8KIY5_PATCE